MLKIGVNLMLFVLTLTFLVLVLVVILRLILLYKKRQSDKFIELWRPILMECVMGAPESLPKLNPKYLFNFIVEWNSLYENLGGVSHGNLIYVALKLDIHRAAMKMLISRNVKIQLTGVITLGHMRTVQAWRVLESIAKSDQIFLSIAAYRSLILIDSNKALDQLLPVLIKRVDWPSTMVAKILKDTDNLKVCELIAEVCEGASEKQLENLIQYINALKCTCAAPVFRKILSSPSDDHLKTLCLQELNDPSAIDLVYKHIESSRWHVRMHAATALGNIGTKKDIKLLDNLLSDKEWWVRYRASQALAKMPFVSTEDLLYKKSMSDNEDVKSILDQVIAEQALL